MTLSSKEVHEYDYPAGQEEKKMTWVVGTWQMMKKTHSKYCLINPELISCSEKCKMLN